MDEASDKKSAAPQENSTEDWADTASGVPGYSERSR
jgi:hypothetical protein